jgi:hypothetical protein
MWLKGFIFLIPPTVSITPQLGGVSLATVMALLLHSGLAPQADVGSVKDRSEGRE